MAKKDRELSEKDYQDINRILRVIRFRLAEKKCDKCGGGFFVKKERRGGCLRDHSTA